MERRWCETGRTLRIKRRGYYRRGHYRRTKTGKTVWVKGTYIPPATYEAKDVGAPGRGRKIIEIKGHGELTKHGYDIHKPAKARRLALAKAVKEDGAAKVWHRLHAQVILRLHQRGSAAKAREVFRRDRDWVAKTYGGPKPTAAIQKWKRMSPRERARRMPGGKV